MTGRVSLANRLRLRPDLVLQPQDAAAGTWVVKDPVSLRFFLFGADEHFIIQRLDGRRSAGAILEDFARERAPRRMTAERLHAFLGSLCASGLATSDAADQASVLAERAEQGRGRRTLAEWTNLLAFRVPGVNPDVFLTAAYPAVRWCFSWWFALLTVVLWVAAVAIAIGHWPALAMQWPRLDQMRTSGQLFWLAVALGGTKVIHELAHAFTCKHFGGRCHEIGLMLLVFTPCLYCNVTDAWMLSSRWRRIAISAAGIVTELWLAAAALVVWRFTEPGVLHSLALSVVFVCSVGTVLFNGNPLLRYDGYFVLSDLMRTPNLWQESRSLLGGVFSRWLMGDGGRQPPPWPRRGGAMIAYALASGAYRVVLTFAIVLGLYKLLQPAGLGVLLLVVAASLAVQTAVAWAGPLARWGARPRAWQRLRKAPAAILLAVALSGVGMFFATPLPCRVTSPATIEATGAERVYVATPGELQWANEPGIQVTSGTVIAKLEDRQLEAERLRIEGELKRAKARVASLEAQVGGEDSAAAELLVAREIAADLAEQSRLIEEDWRSLTIRCETAGRVLPPPPRDDVEETGGRLPAWRRAPLAEENLGCHLDRGVLLCLIATPAHRQATALVDEADIRYLRAGQQAEVQLAHDLATPLAAEVHEIAEVDAEDVPPALLAERDLA
ncbi:MAG: site-2 protease family protein, partial [Planctomycetota bacterium]